MSGDQSVRLQMKRSRVFYLDVPEAVPGPWFGIDAFVTSTIVLIDFLGVPLKVAYDVRVGEVILYPVPQWTAPGLVCFLFALEFARDLMTLKLMGTDMGKYVLVSRQKRSYWGEKFARVLQ